jgi:hypothetical protein
MRFLFVALVLCAPLLSSCCHGQHGGTTALIATVKTLDEAVAAFKNWAVIEEDNIAKDAVAKCKDSDTSQIYDECTKKVIEPRRVPIDRVKLGMRLYLDVLNAANGVQTKDVQQAATSLLDALAAVGIKIGA